MGLEQFQPQLLVAVLMETFGIDTDDYLR
jgi:hypothetical protein